MHSKFTFVKAIMLFICSFLAVSLYSQTSNDEWKSRIKKDISAIGITAADADECSISTSYKDASSGIEYAYIQQNYQQLRVFNNIITLAYKNGKLVHTSGSFVNNIRDMNLKAAPAVEAGTALVSSARHLKLQMPVTVITKQNKFLAERKMIFQAPGLTKKDKDVETELLWVEDSAQKVHLAWNVNIDVAGSADWWNVRVDALSGDVVNKDNWTVHETRNPVGKSQEGSVVKNFRAASYNPFAALNQIKAVSSPSFWIPPNVENASYLVVPFPYDSRNFGPVTIDVNPWLRAGAGNAATTYGWHFDGTDNYLVSRGNNVWAYEDSLNRNAAGRVVTSTTPAPNVTFNIMPDFSKQPFDSTNRNFALVNLFYWNNIIHDVTYQYGFDENAGNFQANNLGRGGAGNDYVRAEAQDGSGTDNANFSTPADGSSGRMQMYLWSAVPRVNITAPSAIAGSYVATESGFSTSNKLIKVGSVTGQIVFYDDPAGGTHLGCDSAQMPLNPVTGKIALVYRGSCDFTNKFRSAQKAGAIAVVVVNNVAGSPITMGGTDNLVVIPGIMISMDDGAKIAAQIANGVTITIATGIQIDGDIDNGIVTHEYGHGVSNRLTGGRVNASCLGNAEQGGEGWSDYLALMLTTDWSTAQLTDGPKLRPMGTYAEGQPATGSGIRRVPYTTNMAIDTLTYAAMAASTEVHNIGEIWCSALWDMTWNIIQHEARITPSIYNSTGGGGNSIALKLVIEGMKLQPCRPGFLDARNGILAADSILYGYRHKCDIWNAFARRGMGVSAIQGLSTVATDQVAAFDVPSGIIIKKSAMPTAVAASQLTTVSMTAACQCSVPTSGFSVTDTLPAGFNYVSSNEGGVLAGNVVKFNTVRFTTALDSVRLNIVLSATGTPCPMINSVSDDRDTDSTGNLVSAKITGNSGWSTSTTRAFNGTSSWYAPDSSRLTNFTLTSAPFTAGNLSVLSFYHFYVTENTLDGGKVEISSDNGTTWVDAGPYFIQNGYNTKLQALALEPNTPAFSGTSNATSSNNNGRFIQSLVNLSAFKGQSIQVRFRFLTNATNASNQFYDGWYIDEIDVNNGCGGISKFMLNSSSGLADSLSVPTFIIPAIPAITTTMVTLAARQAGKQVALNWQTTAELNTSNFTIERSADKATWTAIGYVTAQGSGNGSYAYVDVSPMDVNYYRIRVNNKDWNYSYTPEKLVQLAQAGITSMSPNPASDQAVIYFAGRVTGAELLVTDLTGRIMQRHIVSDNAISYKLETGKLPAGTYLVKLQLKTGTMVTRKLVIGH